MPYDLIFAVKIFYPGRVIQPTGPGHNENAKSLVLK